MEQIALDWGPERRYFTVGEFSQVLRQLIATEFSDIWITGEISGAKLAASGHWYFNLKDETAQLRCVCYRMSARYLKFKPQDGVAVLARGRIDIYDARGEYQMIVELLEPQGLGALQLAFEQLKKKLAGEGLFDSSRKRALPPLPQRIGIVTSPTGAVIRDMVEIIDRRFPGRHIRLFPAQVQGEGASAQITAGIEYFSGSGWAEVVIVARGGGSLEDLWAFNEESVARAIAASAVPVISAVGHETDFTIADFVADLRAPTPSAAAELVTATRQSIVDRVASCEAKLRQAARLTIAILGRRLHAVEIDPARIERAIGKRMQRVDDLEYRLRDCTRSAIERRKRKLAAAEARLAQLDVRLRLAGVARRREACENALMQLMRLRLSRSSAALAPQEAHLRQLSPLRILDRGYAIVQRDSQIVKSPEDAPVGSKVRVRLARGEIGAKVTKL
jgi:exodeoxyribonuclease VII large subunit